MTTLLVLLCQSTVLLSLGFLALRVTQRRGPAVQTLVGRATLCGVGLLFLLLPLSGRIAPVWRLPVSPPAAPAAWKAPILGGREDAGAPLAAPSALPTSPEPPPAVAFPLPATAPTAVGPARQEGTASRAPAPPTAVPNPSFRKGPAIRSNADRHTEERESKAVGLPALLLLFWLAVCQYHLICLRRTAQPVADGPAAALLTGLTPHPLLLLTHPSVHSPFLAGVRRPAIFLPTAFADDFSPDALRAVFLHELAHRDRRDNLWILAARVLTALLWFQPLLWLLGRKLEQISEDACDQAVLAAHCPPRAYAARLLSLAERPPLARSQRTLTAGVAPFRSSVGRRISRILTQGVPLMPTVTLRLRLSIAALTLAAATGGAFLVSSAPAQTQPKPAPVVTPELLTFHAERMQDLANLKAIGLALVHYEARNPNYRLPDAKHWMDQIRPYLPDRSVLFDPFQPGEHRYGYAFNRNCSQKPLFAFDTPASTVAVYESSLGTRNASDTGQSAFSHTVQRSGMTRWTGSGYGFVDGHAKWFITDVHPSFLLQGDPPSALFGVWLRPFPGGENSAMILKPDGSYEDISPRHVGTYNGLVHQYGHYQTHAGKFVYVLTRGWEEDAKPFSFPLKAHDMDYILSGDTLTIGKKGKYENVSHRAPYYTRAMLHLKPDAFAARTLKLRQFTAELARYRGARIAQARDGDTLNQAQFLAGLTPVQGPGVVVTLRDSKKPFPYSAGMPAGMAPPNIIHDSDINQVVNELKAAGAEAIAVNNQRLVATSAVRCAGPTVYVNNTAQAPPFVIQAIGDPKTLAEALTMPGGIASQIAVYDKAMFTVQQAATLTLPAYTGTNAPRYAKPVSAADVPTTPAPPSKVIVTLDDKGFYFLDGVQLPESQIETFLAARARQNPHITAIIKANRNQPYSRVVKLLDVAKQAGIHSFFIAPPASSGAQSASLPSTLPKRSFVVNFWVPSTGTHAVQVYVIDAAGRHLASAKAYGPGTKVNLPVNALGRSVAFQIYDNGMLTKQTRLPLSELPQAASSDTRHDVLLSAMQVRRDQLQLRQMIVGTQIAALNAQMKVQRQGFIQQNKQLKLRKSPAITASETRALLEVLQKEGKEKQFAASALAAQNEILKTANLPPNNPGRIAAQQKFAPILAKLQFLVDVNKYDRQWVALYKSEAKKINGDTQQVIGLRQQQQSLQAQLANINIQIAQESFATNR